MFTSANPLALVYPEQPLKDRILRALLHYKATPYINSQECLRAFTLIDIIS